MLIDQWARYPAFGDRVLSMIGIEVHWAILQYVLGLSFMAFIAYLIHLYTGEGKWERLARTLVKGFVIVFAVGAATGTASEFGLVLLWPNLLEAAGRYIYFPLYTEVFAFIMEVIFIYLMYYGWKKLPRPIVALFLGLSFAGAWFSAAMIISVNSYMVAPTGIEPAYDPESGFWLYSQGYPKLTLVIPADIAGLLNVTVLKHLQVEIVDIEDDGSVVALVPARLVQRLAYEAWSGATVGESVLRAALSEAALSQPGVLNTSVADVVDAILVKTIEYFGVTTVTFKSPVYAASILHTLGSGLTVSGFTVMAAYALRLARRPEGEYGEYVRTAFRFAAAFTAIVIVVQGLVFGHEMGVSVAHYNPEKFAAMEATTSLVTSVTHILPGLDRLAAFLAYGDPEAPLPEYDAIPDDYCACRATLEEDMARIGDCRPPLLIHYLYYAKIGLAVALGLYAAAVAYYLFIARAGPDGMPGLLLRFAPAAAIVAQLVSYLGWAVREIGRKPWTIYGVMTTDVAHTVNPPSPTAIALVAGYFLALLAVLAYSVWRFLWLPPLRERKA